jgi:AraC-like DNA-binding protein
MLGVMERSLDELVLATREPEKGLPAAPALNWELVQRAAAPPLRRAVRDYWGYVEQTAAPLRRRELPTAEIILIVNLGPPLLVEQPGAAPRCVPAGGGFVAGLHDTYAVTETGGSQTGIELRLSPLAAYRLLRQPMDSLVNQTVGFDELGEPWVAALTARVQEAGSWEARFAAFDAALGERLLDAPAPSPAVVWAWRQLVRSGGQMAIGILASELGWSPKRLIAHFREQIGLPPKQAARLLRFQRASHLLADGAADWGALARRHGFYDQSHLIGEFQRFAGDTPEGLLLRRLPMGAGFAAD